MKLISWNVNGIRSCLKKGLLDFVRKENPDILCIQETKGTTDEFHYSLPEYKQYWNLAQRPGYSGTVVFTKINPLKVMNGMGIPKHDNEGRIVTLEFKDFFLVNVYVPNSKQGLERLPYRTKEWDVDFLKYLRKLEKKKSVIFCGDMNVAHREIDLTNPKPNEKNHGFTRQEREGFDNFVRSGFVDTFREFNTDAGHYTWWSHFNNCRQRNIGWRIDYFCISSNLKKRLKEAFILPGVHGSDHCPVGIILK